MIWVVITLYGKKAMAKGTSLRAVHDYKPPPPDRPTWENGLGSCYWLEGTMVDWLEELHAGYQILYCRESKSWKVGLYSNYDAILFKLTWGGC